jgi:hypothetical protein
MGMPLIKALGLTRYLEGPITVILALIGPGNTPSIARALACRVTDQNKQVFIDGQDKAMLDPPPLPGSSVAIVTCLPSTLQTYQFKGTFQHLRPATAAEADWITGPIERMVIEFDKVGYLEEKSRAYLAVNPLDLAVLSFELTAVFEQTPGPNAGVRLYGQAK